MYQDINAYVHLFPEDTRKILQKLRELIKKEAPEATEAIAYGIPTFKLNGNLVHFAAYKNHIGFYPAPSGVSAFQTELKPYIKGKGTIQFPLDQPIPYDLVRKVVRFRIAENARKASK